MRKNQLEEKTHSRNDELTIEQAKAFVDIQRVNGFSLKSGDLQKKTVDIRADWGKAKSSSNENVSVIETEIQAMGGFGFATPESMDAWKATNSGSYLCSMSRLVVIKKTKTGEIFSFIMSVVADKSYFENKHFKLWDNTYLKRDKDLSGYVLFHQLSGEFVNGWIYCDGMIANSITQTEKIDLSVNLKSAEMIVPIYHWETIETDWYNVGSVDGVVTSITYDHTTYKDVYIIVGYYETGSGTDSSGSGGTSGGYTPPLSTQSCDCNICPICGGCLNKLKSAPVDNGNGTTTVAVACPMCPGHPIIDPNKPCAGDPIKNASIASSGASGQYGGTYGCVRQGGTNCSDGIYNKKHGGIDIYAPENSDLYSISAGKVSYVGYITDLGNCIQVTSSDNSTSILYAHLNSQSLAVGNDVKIGDKLGLTGKTGNANDPAIVPHVHIQIKINGVATDPQPFLSTTFNSDGSVSVPCNN